MLTETSKLAFRSLRDAITESEKSNLVKAYILAGCNVSNVALGLCLSRATVHKYLYKHFGEDYRAQIVKYISQNRANVKVDWEKWGIE